MFFYAREKREDHEMTDFQTFLEQVKRPRLLVRAAKLGLAQYNRSRDLKRLVREPVLPAPERALAKLISEEAALEESRRSGGATYSLARHIDLLIAMMAEARLLPSPRKTAL